MEKKAAGQIKSLKLHHVGVVVKNLDKTIAYLESLGIGPFEFKNGEKSGTASFNGELHDKPAAWKTRISNANL